MIEKGDLLIEGDYVDQDGDQHHGQIKVVGGMIASVDNHLGEPDISFSDGLVIYPGFIDLHVHARDFAVPSDADEEVLRAYGSQTAKEDYISMCAAAVNGGVVAFADMPNNPVHPKDEMSYSAKMRVAYDKCTIDHVLYALIADDSEPFGDVPYKIYTHDFSKRELEMILSRFHGVSYDPVIAAHCENKNILRKHPERPVEAEVKDVEIILDIAARYKLQVHIAHVSAAKSIDSIIQAKLSGVKVTCETTPTYLFFSRENMSDFVNRKLLTMKPPIRSEKDRERLLEAFLFGDIDCLATDHAPHTLEDKKKCAFGIPLEDHYTNFVGWLLQQGIPEKVIVDCCSRFPGEFFHRYTGDRFGQIRPGYVGSFTVVGKGEPFSILRSDIMTRCGWSPFEDAVLGDDHSLYAHETIVRGVPMKSQLLKEQDR